MCSPCLVMNRVGSIEPFENPLDTRKLESSSYHALGVGLRPYNAFLRREVVLELELDMLIECSIGGGICNICCCRSGHYKKDCPKLKNKNRGNQARNGKARARAYVVGNARTNSDSNVVTGMFLLNNRYASILFDTGADRSFVSTAFSSLIDIVPTTLDHDYDVELADEKIIGVNTIIRGCTLNFLNHPFNIDLMPVELGSFDVIIGMDLLSKYHVVIFCDEKIVRIPLGMKS
ncbi:putative reverse transcriptase domain-containing protein [Tanacetum coccineum]